MKKVTDSQGTKYHPEVGKKKLYNYMISASSLLGRHDVEFVAGSVCISQFFTYRGTYTTFYTKFIDVGVSSLSKKRFFEGLLEKRANTTKSLSNLYLNHTNLHGFCTSFRRDI